MIQNLPVIPHGNNVLVAPVDEPSPLWLPKTARRPQRAVVLDVGAGLVGEDGVRAEPPCRAGDLIAHRTHAGTDLDWRGNRLTVMKFDDIYGVLVDSVE